jgi:hypothetical protein
MYKYGRKVKVYQQLVPSFDDVNEKVFFTQFYTTPTIGFKWSVNSQSTEGDTHDGLIWIT